MATSPEPPKSKTDLQIQEEFTSYYLQRVTKEFAEDLDKIRTADDFKNDALPLLISALQQGSALFSPEEQRRIVTAKGPAPTAPEVEVSDDMEVTETAKEDDMKADAVKDDGAEKKKKKKEKKQKQ